MKLSTLLVWALPAALVAAAPGTEAKNSGVCRGKELKGLKGNPTIRQFCYSFLAVTSTSTTIGGTATAKVRTTVTSATTITSVVTKTKVVTSTTTNKTTKTITSLSAASNTCAPSAGFLPGSIRSDSVKSKREVKSTPTQLTGMPSASLSSICSCLKVPLRTKSAVTRVAGTTTTITTTVSKKGVRTFTTYPRTTVTSTSIVTAKGLATVTVTYVQPTPTTFNGLNWYAYKNNYDFTDGTPNYNFASFNSPNYEDAGHVLNAAAVAPGNAQTCTLPFGTKQLNCVQLTVVEQGYLFAAENGTYTLTTGGSSAASVDNLVALFTGDKAYNSYDNNNADFVAIRADHSTIQRGGTFTITLQEGQLLPVTIIYMNGGYAGNFQFHIITPSGNEYPDTNGFWVPACANNDPFSP